MLTTTNPERNNNQITRFQGYTPTESSKREYIWRWVGFIAHELIANHYSLDVHGKDLHIRISSDDAKRSTSNIT